MNTPSSALRYYGVLIVLYLSLVLLLPANKIAMAHYNLSSTQYHVLLFAVVLPYVGIWLAAFYGYHKLGLYAQTIKHSAEGPSFALLARGCTWLAWSLPIAAFVSLIFNSIANSHPSLYATAIIISNYVGVLLPLIAFTIIGKAARELATSHNIRLSIGVTRLLVVTFALLGVLYCFLALRHFNLASLTSTDNPYYLPLWLMLTTIMIPYLYSWYVGLLAASELIAYAHQARGLFYRSALRYLGYGFVAVIASFIALQCVNSVIPRTGSLRLNLLLILNYAIRFVAVVGFILIAMGANRLKKIEDV